MMGYKIDPATSTHVARIAQIHVEVWQKAYRGLIPDQFLDSLDTRNREAYWRGVIRDGRDQVFIGHDANDIFGFCSIGPTRDSDLQGSFSELMTLYVLPEHWGSDVGNQLIQRAHQTCIDDSGLATNCMLWVLKDNRRARSFYAKHGYGADGQEKTLDWEQSASIEIRMIRTTPSV